MNFQFFRVFPQYLNYIQVRTLTWPLRNLSFVSFEAFRDRLACVLRIIVLLHNPILLEIWSQTDRWAFSFRIF